MKKSTIWVIAIIMGLSFLGLLYMQISYIEEIAKMKKEQFDESVNRSLYQASRNLELNETLRYLEKDVNDVERRAYSQDSIIVNGLDGSIQHAHQFSVSAEDGTFYSEFELKTFATKPANVPKAMMMRTDKDQLSEATKSLQEIVRNRYVYQKALLDEVVYNILYTASEKPLKERINFKLLDQDIRNELQNNGIDIPYHLTVRRCQDSLPRHGLIHLFQCTVHDSCRDFHHRPAAHIHLHHRGHLPSEALHRDQERLHQQHDP